MLKVRCGGGSGGEQHEHERCDGTMRGDYDVAGSGAMVTQVGGAVGLRRLCNAATLPAVEGSLQVC